MRDKPGVAETLDLAECGPNVRVSMFACFIAEMKTFLTVTVVMFANGFIKAINSLEFSFQ